MRSEKGKGKVEDRGKTEETDGKWKARGPRGNLFWPPPHTLVTGNHFSKSVDVEGGSLEGEARGFLEEGSVDAEVLSVEDVALDKRVDGARTGDLLFGEEIGPALEGDLVDVVDDVIQGEFGEHGGQGSCEGDLNVEDGREGVGEVALVGVGGVDDVEEEGLVAGTLLGAPLGGRPHGAGRVQDMQRVDLQVLGVQHLELGAEILVRAGQAHGDGHQSPVILTIDVRETKSHRVQVGNLAQLLLRFMFIFRKLAPRLLLVRLLARARTALVDQGRRRLDERFDPSFRRFFP